MSTAIVRVGGVSAVLAGVLIIVQEVWSLAVGRISEGRLESTVHTTQVLLMVFAIVGLHLAQQHAAGLFGQVATLVALLGTVTLFGVALTEVTIVPELMASGSPLADDPPPTLSLVSLVSFVLFIVGLLLFGIAIWRARVLPRRAGALLVVGIVLGAALSQMVNGILTIYAVAFIWLGIAAFRLARRPVLPPLDEPVGGHTFESDRV
jgi:hypothetical protein